MTDVVVVGAGVVGASAAYRAAVHGARVTLVEAAREGAATLAGAGIISPGTVMARNDDVPDGFLPLAYRAGTYYQELLEQLASDGERDAGFAVVGSLTIAADAEEASRMPAVLARMSERAAAGAALVGTVAWVDGPQVRDLFPLLSDRLLAGAIFASGAARVDGRLLAAALRRAATRRGVRTIEGTARLYVDAGKVSVEVDGERVQSDAVLIAAGAWSGLLAQASGWRLPIVPERGQIAQILVPDHEVERWPTLVGFTDTSYMVGFSGRRLAVGATREPGTGFDARLTTAGVHDVLSAALRLAPALADATLQEVRVGLRPVTPDRLPVLGRIPETCNAYVCAGHGHFGLLLGPYSGAAIADSMLGLPAELDHTPYRVERFSSATDHAA